MLVVVVAAFLVAVNQLMRLHAPIRQIKKSYMSVSLRTSTFMPRLIV